MGWSTSNRKQNRSGSGWAEQRAAQAILERDGHRCYLASKVCTVVATEVDHVIPLHITGPAGDCPANKKAVCQPCHKRKTLAERPRPAPLRRPPERHPGLR